MLVSEVRGRMAAMRAQYAGATSLEQYEALARVWALSCVLCVLKPFLYMMYV